MKKKADETFKNINSFMKLKSISDNLVQKQNKLEKEGFKRLFTTYLIGYDFEKLNDAIVKIKNHAQISSLTTSLSNKVKAELEEKLTQIAIKNFQKREQLVAKSFGFKSFTSNKAKLSNVFAEDSYRNFCLYNNIKKTNLNSNEKSSNDLYILPRHERISLTVKGSIFLK